MSVTEWKPWIAFSVGTGPSGQTVRFSAELPATSSSSMPSGSWIVITSPSKRVARDDSMCKSRSRFTQNSNDPSGIVKPTVVTWLLPVRRLGQVGHPKKVIAVPGEPR